ncbi:peptidylprolyl isomerase [Clostridium vincentii]|uniref:Putative peptidyl-prolyl cis-trans isomerase Cbf2 n=1 Tax=Clostridium vincentii TaxID=52704 RepID=A0A2T0BK45_9CLOT|nr:peptidylprolyl isomerase [Clostridium vincentii]PRR84260.1 putative peptidyl-prolyl cis-trans isomerase Cbf2 precursor [Clostridium vincentii]
MENKIWAVVAGNEITEKDLTSIIMRYPEDKRSYFEDEKGKKQILEQTIAFELFNKFGEEIKLDNTDEFKEAVNNLSKEILTQMTINKVLSEVTVTDEDAKKFYDENKEKFVQKPTVSAKHILVKTEEEAKNIKNEITEEKISFEDSAIKYSTCPSKEQGGNLGSFERGMMVPEFEEVAFNAEIGKLTDGVKTQFGYHLIVVEDKKEGSEKTFDEVKDMVIGQLIQEGQQKKYIDVVMELEGKYGVDRK